MEKIKNIQQVIERLDREEMMLYVGNEVDLNASAKKNIALFTHELKRSGAPTVLLNMSRVLVDIGYTVFLVADEEGELLEEFVESGVNVVFYPKLTSDPAWLLTVAETFDHIVVNTLVLINFVSFLAPYAKKVYWWIHEAEKAIENWVSRIETVPKVPSLKILAASPLIQRNLKDYWNMESELLNFYIEDVPARDVPRGEKLNIINVGDVNGNKGQEILVRAFDKLDEATKAKCDLYFCGENARYNEALLLEVLDYADTHANVHMLGGLPKDELYEIYDEVDIVVVSSYYESTSAVAVEGMMKGKLCICTETCGVCDYLKNEESVFTFKRGDENSLSEVLYKAINNYQNYDVVREKGRKVFEKIYTKENFVKCLKEILEGDFEINPKMNACTGCGACQMACPVGAIQMEINEKGFWYPVIDDEKCIRCEKCVKVCPVNENAVYPSVKEAYAFMRNDINKRMESQSGGAFSAIAERVIQQGGVVYGVALDEQRQAVYIRVEKEEELIKLKGSKYVQANLKDTYEKIKDDIKSQKVLFGGTPCYVAGLKNYLQNVNTDNLLTCDLICHGVPSPSVYNDYLEHLKNRHENFADFKFRDKTVTGWHGHMETYEDENGNLVADDVYANIFYTDACLRESCYNCQYANTERVADITVGDFWGIEKVFPKIDDNKGVSLVLVNSEKGHTFWKEHKNDEIIECEIDKCLQRNLQIPTPRSHQTEEFWIDYMNCDYKKIIRKYGQARLYEKPNLSVLNCWQSKLDRGMGLTTILGQRQIASVFVMGNKKHNQFAIVELKKGNINVAGEICYEKNSGTGLVPTLEVNDELMEKVQEVDTILVTDESNMVDVLEILHKANIPMEKITPLSFVVDEEV